MTTGEIIDAVLRWYVNQGSSVVTEDREQREKAWFHLQKVGQRLWNAAPWWFKKSDGTINLTAGVGTLPSDFSVIGTQVQVYIQGQLYRPLKYMPYDWIRFQIQNSPQTGTPWAWTLFGQSSLGLAKILCWPQDDSVLDLRGYDRQLVELVDHPTACVAAATSAAGVLTGTYSYKITFVTADGETEAGPVSNVVTVAAKNIDLTDIPVWWGRRVTSRKIYRTAAGGNVYKLVATIADNVTTTYTDSTLDVALGAVEPDIATVVTGAEIFPIAFHDSALYEGLVFWMSRTQGDGRDDKFWAEWTRAVQRTWEEVQLGQNEINAFPAFPGFGTGGGIWTHFVPPR